MEPVILQYVRVFNSRVSIQLKTTDTIRHMEPVILQYVDDPTCPEYATPPCLNKTTILNG